MNNLSVINITDEMVSPTPLETLSAMRFAGEFALAVLSKPCGVRFIADTVPRHDIYTIYSFILPTDFVFLTPHTERNTHIHHTLVHY